MLCGKPFTSLTHARGGCLLTVAKTRRIHQDGIRFQGLRYIDLNLAAFVGEEVMIRYDPRDLAEIRVYHQNHFLCRAVCQELAGQTVGIKEIAKARDERRRQLQHVIRERRSLVEVLTRPLITAGPIIMPELATGSAAPVTTPRPVLKRYVNE